MHITLVFIVCVCLAASISGVPSCVMTTQRPEGPGVRLMCNFSQCGGSLGLRDTIEWWFQSNSSSPEDHIIDKDIWPNSRWSNVRFTGNLSLGDFSILLQSVESLKHTGKYSCRLRLNGIIHKNSVNVTFRMTRNILTGYYPYTVHSNSVHPNKSSVTRSPRQLAVCCIGILLFLVGGALVGKWAWHKKALQRPAVQSSQNTDPPLQGNLNAAEVKDANLYVTLQRIKPTPQPALSPDSIYVSMRFNRDDPLHPGELPRKRSGLPEEWRAEETAASSAEEIAPEVTDAEEIAPEVTDAEDIAPEETPDADEVAASGGGASSLPETADDIYARMS
ncbi:uncharacterized protein LOC134099694 [Sardina pilchardus]|uniref:uncharacterized protein LOC134099694 n=1 Tax=Sardina pilchardus TaxID=27697 RepID=UPI002E156459